MRNPRVRGARSPPSPPEPDAAGRRTSVEPFRFLTAGESHGPMLGAVVEGVPAGLDLTEDDLAVDLARRQRVVPFHPRLSPAEGCQP